MRRLLDQALARADSATLAGEDAEAALLRLVQGESQPRRPCGRALRPDRSRPAG